MFWRVSISLLEIGFNGLKMIVLNIGKLMHQEETQKHRLVKLKLSENLIFIKSCEDKGLPENLIGIW